MGHIVSKDAIQPVSTKVEAIVKALIPANVQQLRSFLGLTNHYGKFISNLATILHPLNAECAKAFQAAKEQIISASVLTYYDPTLPITLAADASAYAVGAVISYILLDNTEHPITFALHTLTTSEQNYAQLEKETLALIFGIKKFHRYLYSRKFTFITDHKPLTTILGPKEGIPSLAAAHLQRWAIFRVVGNTLRNIITFAVTSNITRYIPITFAVMSKITRYIPM